MADQNTTLAGSAVAEVAALAQEAQTIEPRITEINGETYSTTPLHRVAPAKEAEPAPLVVHTLTGLLDYIAGNRDELNWGECIVHVVDPGKVEIRGALLGHHRQRLTFLRAEHFDRFTAFPNFQFGRYMPAEQMIIALQALFEDTSDRAQLLVLLGGVKAVDETLQSDDGVTQHVQVRKGVHLTAAAPAPTRLILTPYRTFPEVPQPSSVFFFRIKDGGDGQVSAALFEADGGAWRLAAIDAIDAYLTEGLSAAGVNSEDDVRLVVIA